MYLYLYISRYLSPSINLYISQYLATEPRRILGSYPGVDLVPEGGGADVD